MPDLSGPVGDTQPKRGFRERLIEMLAQDDDPSIRHGQLCPCWVRRASGATIWDCDCWRLRQHQRTADKAVAALAEIGEHHD